MSGEGEFKKRLVLAYSRTETVFCLDCGFNPNKQTLVELGKSVDEAAKDFPVVTTEMMAKATAAQLEVYLLTYQNKVSKWFGVKREETPSTQNK